MSSRFEKQHSQSFSGKVSSNHSPLYDPRTKRSLSELQGSQCTTMRREYSVPTLPLTELSEHSCNDSRAVEIVL